MLNKFGGGHVHRRLAALRTGRPTILGSTFALCACRSACGGSCRTMGRIGFPFALRAPLERGPKPADRPLRLRGTEIGKWPERIPFCLGPRWRNHGVRHRRSTSGTSGNTSELHRDCSTSYHHTATPFQKAVRKLLASVLQIGAFLRSIQCFKSSPASIPIGRDVDAAHLSEHAK